MTKKLANKKINLTAAFLSVIIPPQVKSDGSRAIRLKRNAQLVSKN
jgi:hypothetical protein